ncbi:MAG: hypothetical protein JXQ29_11965 [Planctomycetes bacterium]|nr:hypothetical protein [Planctomycetota bacterium]
MSRLQDLLQDLRIMPGVESAFLCCREGIIAATHHDHERQKRMGRVFLNILSGAFSLGHFVREIYSSYDTTVLMIRPVSRGCILVARCKPDVTMRLVDISLTMTVKSIEEELNGMDELPPPIERRGAADREAGAPGDGHLRTLVETRTEG